MTTETALVTARVLDLSPCHHSDLLALADVEIVVAGVAFVLHGVQLRADTRRTQVTLPRYRATDGEWRAAVTLPEELRGPVGDVVIAAGLDAGILKDKGNPL